MSLSFRERFGGWDKYHKVIGQNPYMHKKIHKSSGAIAPRMQSGHIDGQKILQSDHLCCTDTAILKWTRHMDTWQILKHTHDTRVRHVRLRDRSVRAT